MIMNDNLRRVVDLGCGGSKEFATLNPATLWSYISVDTEKRVKPRIVSDFRVDPVNLWKLASSIAETKLTGFVSLFASEVHACEIDNYELYDKLFTIPEVECGLVSGFYYNEGEYIREENGYTPSLDIYQVISEADWFSHPRFREYRIVVPCKSNRFGLEIEVWKYLERI